MAQHEPETADDCRQWLQQVAEVLEHLHDQATVWMGTVPAGSPGTRA